MQGTHIVYGLVGALAIALLVAAFTDIRRRQIDNWLNAAVAAGAPLFWWASSLPLWPGVALQLTLAVVTFFVLAGLFAMKVMGGAFVIGADFIGAWLLELKVPVLFPELEFKVAAGLGGLLDEVRPGVHLIPGFGCAYGVDLHVPFFASSGATVGLTFLHALVPAHYFTVGVGVGYTFF